MDEGEEVDGSPVIAGGEASEVLEFVEAAFDAISILVGDLVVRPLERSAARARALVHDPSPIFIVFSLTIPFAAFAVDAVLRAYAQTRFLLVMNIVRFAVVVLLIVPLLWGFGLIGAVLVTLLLLVTFDLDRPTRGLITVPDASLAQVRASMVLPPAAKGP